jgi:DNA-binding SARP family transcriptional activator
MPALAVRLLGPFAALVDGAPVAGLEGRRVQDLFAYLLLTGGRRHAREALAGLLWGDSPTAHARKYLRQGLWQLQSALGPRAGLPARLLTVEPDWVCLQPCEELWLDVAVVKAAHARTLGVPAAALDPAALQAAREAADLYRGALLEGCYHDWCLHERAHLEAIHVALLDKLIVAAEARGDFEAGIEYGARILAHDRACERTHRRLMRLHYLAGDRTAALRQFAACAAALDLELGVRPARVTIELHEQIRSDRLAAPPVPDPTRPDLPAAGILGDLKQIHALLTALQQQAQRDIRSLERLLHPRR